MNHNYPTTQHHHSHQRLVLSAAGNPGPTSPHPHFDAIIVPSARHARYLAHAIDLALATGSWLVVLSSHSSQALEVCALSAAMNMDRTVVIQIPVGYTHPLIEFSSSRSIHIKRANRGHNTDLSIKRNIGLILARMLRWRKIFFLDDDIRGLTAAGLSRAASLLDQYRCVAFSVNYFPDNSVVCHASRLGLNKQQGVFVTGAAMGISLSPDLAFFPNIYNEDLFFAYDDIGRGILVHAGSLNQLPYLPFQDSGRAASQEFGDVLIEGLLAQLHAGVELSYVRRDYWERFLPARQAFISAARSALQQIGDGTGHQGVALASLRAAEDRLSKITPSLCVTYLTKWRADILTWRQRLQCLSAQTSMSTALRALGLIPVFAGNAPRSVAFGCSRLSAPRSKSHSPKSVIVPNVVDVRELSKDEWPLLRQIRLQALRDSPRAFISSYQAEVAYTDSQWRDLIGDASRWFIAYDGTKFVGLTAATIEPDGPSDQCHVEGMWVASSSRQSGVATELVTKLINAMSAAGRHTIMLWVLNGNDVARNAYLHLGFTPTGERQPSQADPSRSEERMRLLIPGSA